MEWKKTKKNSMSNLVNIQNEMKNEGVEYLSMLTINCSNLLKLFEIETKSKDRNYYIETKCIFLEAKRQFLFQNDTRRKLLGTIELFISQFSPVFQRT